MTLAVSALGPSLEDRVDERFGRAHYLLFVDEQDGTLEAVDNTTNRNALQAAGIATAELVSDRGATAVITGHLGPKAFAALGAAGIPGYDGSGMTVREALDRFVEGGLRKLDEAGEAHQG
ncbi:MAG: NifB/NifX family molybdenum-iron cluster-binding protein [Aeromicrobium sp.]|nr:NifB/NifX family molybdenum-iron cluster-binding protein [Aeromicrobium sp.]